MFDKGTKVRVIDQTSRDFGSIGTVSHHVTGAGTGRKYNVLDLGRVPWVMPAYEDHELEKV